MPINYKPVGWDTTKFVGPTNLNQMDNGIKAACDGVDALTEEVTEVNESLGEKVSTRFIKSISILDTSLEDGQYMFNDAKDAPISSTGYLTVQTHHNNPDLYRKVSWKPAGYETEYRNTMINGEWQGWDSVTLNSDLNEMRFGSVTITSVPVGEKASLAVTFDTEMPNIPVVTVSGHNRYPEYYSEITVDDVTTKGFTVYAKNNYTSTANIKFSYIAVCKRK